MNVALLFVLLALLYFAVQGAVGNEGSGSDGDRMEEDSLWQNNDQDVLNALNITEGELLTESVCNGSTLNAFQRDFIVKTHNDLRRSLAFGRQRNKRGLMSTGRNMYNMEWDCELAEMAADWIAGCPRRFMPQELLGSYSQLFKMFWFYFDGKDQNEHIRSALKSWWAQGETQGNDDPKNRYFSKSNYYNWANMAKGKTYRVGCAYTTCPDGHSSTFTCIYNEKAQCEEEMIYEVGQPCKSDDDCFTYPGSRCIKSEGLCKAPHIPKDSGDSEMCANSNMTDLTRIWALDQHNFYRSRIARGLEWNGETNSTQPKAKKMFRLEYDCDLEEYAQEWADKCVFAHSSNAERPNQGQNLYMTSFSNPNPRSLFHSAIQKWWQELEEYGTPGDNMLTADLWTKKGKAIGHYTQMAWEKSFRLGCAMANCPNMAFVVCHYGPAGNRRNSRIYEIGEPCKHEPDCPGSSYCDRKSALCCLDKNFK